MKKTLKKFFTLSAIVSTLFFAACSDNDDSSSEKKEKTEVEDTLNPGSITIPEADKAKTDTVLVSEGQNALASGNYDAAIEKFRSAYAKKQSDANKIYYALAEIATISTDEKIADFIKNNLGVVDYPQTLNAIIDTDSWFKEYHKFDEVEVAEAEKSATGRYIRVDGERTSYSSDSTYIAYGLDEDDDWVYSYDLYGRENRYLKNITPKEDGKYLISFWNYYRANNPTNLSEEEFKETIASYLYDDADWYEKPVLGKILKVAGLRTPEWVKEKDTYNNSLIKSAETVKTLSYLLFANIVDLNKDGFNAGIDKVLSVFDKKYGVVKALVDSLENENAELSSELIETLNLDGIFGEDSVSLGKPEMQVLTSVIGLVDATLNYVASYDLTADLTNAKIDWDNLKKKELVNVINACVKAKTLTVRDATKMETSKKVFSDSVGYIISAYETVKDSNNYPQIAKDMISEYGENYYNAAKLAKDAIENGKTFYIPEGFENWESANAENSIFGIDMSKIFKAGYFTDIVERDSSKENVKIYYRKCTDSYGRKDGEWFDDSIFSDLTEITGDISAKIEELKQDEELGYSINHDEDWSNYEDKEVWYEIGIKINTDIIKNAVPGLSNILDEDEYKLFEIFTISD